MQSRCPRLTILDGQPLPSPVGTDIGWLAKTLAPGIRLSKSGAEQRSSGCERHSRLWGGRDAEDAAASVSAVLRNGEIEQSVRLDVILEGGTCSSGAIEPIAPGSARKPRAQALAEALAAAGAEAAVTGSRIHRVGGKLVESRAGGDEAGEEVPCAVAPPFTPVSAPASGAGAGYPTPDPTSAPWGLPAALSPLTASQLEVPGTDPLAASSPPSHVSASEAAGLSSTRSSNASSSPATLIARLSAHLALYSSPPISSPCLPRLEESISSPRLDLAERLEAEASPAPAPASVAAAAAAPETPCLVGPNNYERLVKEEKEEREGEKCVTLTAEDSSRALVLSHLPPPAVALLSTEAYREALASRATAVSLLLGGRGATSQPPVPPVPAATSAAPVTWEVPAAEPELQQEEDASSPRAPSQLDEADAGCSSTLLSAPLHQTILPPALSWTPEPAHAASTPVSSLAVVELSSDDTTAEELALALPRGGSDSSRVAPSVPETTVPPSSSRMWEAFGRAQMETLLLLRGAYARLSQAYDDLRATVGLLGSELERERQGRATEVAELKAQLAQVTAERDALLRQRGRR